MSRPGETSPSAPSKEPLVLLIITAAATIVSGWNPHKVDIWFMEASPVLIGMALLIWTRRRFPLTPLLYRLIFLHSLILLLGAHYSYALVPLGEWLRDSMDMARNPYDRIGHFAQGFIPAILSREILLRTSPLRPGGWLFFLVTCVCLAFSAFYELIEWVSAVIIGDAADDFLGTQGDVWDAQWDMCLALIGAVTAQLLLSGVHARQLKVL